MRKTWHGRAVTVFPYAAAGSPVLSVNPGANMSFFQSITAKVLGVAVLALLMLIPLAQVQELVRERNGLREEAVTRIAQGWGAAQIVGGPLLVATRRIEPGTPGWSTGRTTERELRLPQRLAVAAHLDPERRQYGIYSAPVYVAHLELTAHFDAADLARVDDETGERALVLPIADPRGLRRIEVKTNGSEARVEPGAPVDGHALVQFALPAHPEGGLDVEVRLDLAGTERLQFLPLARSTEVTLSAPWPDPSFTGAFLPAQRTIDVRHVEASWQVLDLNRGFGQRWLEHEMEASTLDGAAFGLALYQPVDLYQQNVRAGKYGLLFIALTFAAFFLFEVLKRLRVHPVQYLFIGLALATFYIVLLALSEQIGFGLAYALAATAVVGLVGGYAAAVLATRRAGLLLGSLLAAVYGLLYVLVASEQYSLLVGSCALLGLLGAAMFLTRKVDWYRYGSATEARSRTLDDAHAPARD